MRGPTRKAVLAVEVRSRTLPVTAVYEKPAGQLRAAGGAWTRMPIIGHRVEVEVEVEILGHRVETTSDRHRRSNRFQQTDRLPGRQRSISATSGAPLVLVTVTCAAETGCAAGACV